MASASELQAGTAPLPMCDAMRGWGVAKVALWALTIDGIDAEDAAILAQNKITGADLLDRVTEEKLVLYKVPGGPAGRIMSALTAIKPVDAAVQARIGDHKRRRDDESAHPPPLLRGGQFPDTVSVAAAGLTSMPPLGLYDPLSIFLQGMLSSDVTETDSAIALPRGITWPDLNSPVLFKRLCYQGLWRNVLHEGHAKDLRGAVICGSPGIAKSVFGLVAIYRAVKGGRTVVYNSRKGGRAMFKNGVAYDIPTDLTNLPELNDHSTLYLSDSLPPVAYKAAFRLLITSPKKENWSSFTQSPGVQLFVLPMFSEDEMMKLRTLAFETAPFCSLADVEERILKWGSSPRNVLTQASNDTWQSRLSSVGSTLSLGTLERALQFSTALDGVSSDDQCHRLINLVPRGALPDSDLLSTDPRYFHFHHAELVTPIVEALFADHLLLRHIAELHRFLHCAARDPSIAGFRGILYERAVVIPRLTQGKAGKVLIQRLSPPLESFVASVALNHATLSFSAALPIVHFRKVAELKALWDRSAEDAIFVPLSKEFPVVDFVLRLNGAAILANATVGESHDVKVGNATFYQLLDAVGLQSPAVVADAGTEVPIVWVLPQEAFDRFVAPGPLKGASGGKRIAQYKMLVVVP